MATSKTTSISGYWGSHPKVTYSGTVKITRESTTTKNITVSVSIDFSLNSGGCFNAGYSLKVYGDTNGANDTNGWTSRELVGNTKWENPTVKTKTWTRTFSFTSSTLTWKMYANDTTDNTHDYKSSSDPKTFSCSVPTYSSSSSSGGSTTVSKGTVTGLTFNPTQPKPNETVVATITGTAGTNNTISGYKLYLGTEKTLVGSVSTTSTSGQITFTAPSAEGTYYYYPYLVNGYDGSLTDSASWYTLMVINPVYTPTNVSVGSVEGDGSSTLCYIRCNCDSDAYYSVGSTGTKTAMTYSSYGGYYYDFVYLTKNDTVYFYGYNGTTYSSAVTAKPSITYSVKNVTLNINPIILKDNLSTPDLANIIQNGYASAQTSGGSLTYTWQYAQSSTTSGLSSASYNDLGISGSSFNNLDMTQKVTKGYYYKFRVQADNGYQTGTSDDSEIYQIPNKPGNVTFTKIVPKADPSEGYTESVQDGKTYYGSGLFLLWNNPTVDSSRIPINDIEIIYQSKKESDTTFGEVKTAAIQYHKLLEQGETEPTLYVLDTSSDASNGGGADLEVESLYETKIGIRITDELGEYTDTFYTTQNYFKAKAPDFGGNLIFSLGESVDAFRPFTCDENLSFSFTSSVASSTQDTLYYFIRCYVNDRKIEPITIVDGIGIATSIFSDDTISAGTIIYPENSDGTEDIIIKKENSTTIRYIIKNSYFKNILLENKELRTPKNNLSPVYNTDFVDVVYKIFVKDDFDSSSTTYSSNTSAIKYIEAPTLANNNFLELGINRYLLSENPTYDDSIILINSESTNNDRIINPGESIVFKFKRALDYNNADYATTMTGDVTQYNLYVSRNDSIVTSGYDNLIYSLLKTYSANLNTDTDNPGDLKNYDPNNSNNEYYYFEYPLLSYQDSKFVVFKIEAIDSKMNKSEPLYSNTYLVPCRATSMDFFISNIKLETKNVFDPYFKTKVNDFGAATFINNLYSYNIYPNYERTFTIGKDDNTNNFVRKGKIIIEGSLDGDFTNKGTFIVNSDDNTYTYNNFFSQEIDLSSKLTSETNYLDVIENDYSISEFPTEWQEGLSLKILKKVFFRVTYKIAYGFKDVSKSEFDDRYLVVTSTSAPYSYYDDSPTVSYRNHQVGINTKDFSEDSEGGQQEVLIVQDNGSYNLVVFKGAEKKIIINLTDRTFTATTENNETVTINFNNGYIDGMTIDGGNW